MVVELTSIIWFDKIAHNLYEEQVIEERTYVDNVKKRFYNNLHK